VTPLSFRARAEVALNGNAAAVPFYDRALSVCVITKNDHITCDSIRVNRAALIARLGNGKRALEEVQTAIQAMEKRGEAIGPVYAEAFASKAIAMHVLGRQIEAEAARAEAIARYQKLFGNEHPETISVRKILEGIGKPVK